MGTLESKPYDVAEGQEYVDYLRRVHDECLKLRTSGRLPDTDELAGFLDTAARVVDHMSREVAAAAARGEVTTVSRIPMGASEHARLVNMNDSLRTLLEILELRQALELNRTPSVARVADAVLTGRYAD